MEGVDQRTPMEFLVEHAWEETEPSSLRIDHVGTDLFELPVAGEGERDLILPSAEVLGIVTPPKEHTDIDSSIFQGVDEIHNVGLDASPIAVLPVIGDKCGFHTIFSSQFAITDYFLYLRQQRTISSPILILPNGKRERQPISRHSQNNGQDVLDV